MESSGSTNYNFNMSAGEQNMDIDWEMETPSTSSAALQQNKRMRKCIGAVSKKSWRFRCEKCEKSYRTKGELKKHMDVHLNPTNCLICGKVFQSSFALQAHSKLHEEFINCEKCQINVSRLDWGHHLRTRSHKQANGIIIDFSENVKLKSSDFMERIEVYTYTSKEPSLDIGEFFATAEADILNILNESLIKHINFKFNFELECLYIKDSGDLLKVETMTHVTKMKPVTRSDLLDNIYKEKVEDIKTKMSEFQERDSGWALYRISILNININKHSIIRGSSDVILPYKVAKLNACLNIKNKDEFCFKWCVIAAIKNKWNEKCSSYPDTYGIENINSDIISVNGLELNFKNMKFPLDLKEISIFESQNTFISINVFGFDRKGDQIVGPYFKCKETKPIHINLLLVENDECTKRHFVLINELSR